MHPQLARLVARPIAHRGLHGCGARGPIENSIGAAEAAAAASYGIECDVQLSRDGEAIVFHDAELDRLTGKAGRVGDLDAAALRETRLTGADDHLPSLQEFLAAIGGRVAVVIEVKSAGGNDMRLTDRTLAVLEGYRGAASIESFDPAVIRRCRALHATRPVGLVGPPDAGPLDESVLASCDFLSWSIADLPAAAARFPDIPLTTWTVRTRTQEETARRCKAQIVFESLVPTSDVNDAVKDGRGLSF